ncbi:hypothetical protein SAMN04515654_12124 [Halanaerobium congolense]|uniref:Uncharacterized protein n=1 Tax=Halanaerobium congolense TaxID=54121 RepID=A0A1G8PTM4_9FIRM|nr:hypothetical protein [Halanaerobium congolense]SDI95821.1 hypothetical protein SAMN04515654_12124 [Halanaerobium congolense]SES90456.1 hypothetical protein SAMN04515653_10424 [Halanaerobium congolense]
MLKVKANWKVGYPAGPGRKIYLEGDVFTCDDNWGHKKAEQGRVNILKEVEEKKKEPVIKMTELTVDEADEVIDNCKDIKQLEDWLQEEKKNKDRKTTIEYLTDRLEELRRE